MGEIVNLRRVKRTRLRAQAANAAGEQRAVHGRTKGEREAVEAERKRSKRLLDGAALGSLAQGVAPEE